MKLSHSALGRLITTVVALVFICQPLAAEETVRDTTDGAPDLLVGYFADEIPHYQLERFLTAGPPENYTPKMVGHYGAQDWATAIDTTWGVGIDSALKADYFKFYWNYIVDYRFSCFLGLSDTVWDSVYNLYWPDAPINFDYSAVSKGRFAAILQHSSRALQEAHQKFYDNSVSSTAMLPGVPLMYLGHHYFADHFGAAVTVGADSTAFVYDVVESHPLGLEPGDEILGYDGIAWPELAQELIDAQLPIRGPGNWGSSDPTVAHRLLMNPGMNWHLFDVIDVRKYATGDTVHFSTSLLDGQDMELFGTEQLPTYGIERPGYNRTNPDQSTYLSWGVVDGANIGYIYCMGWFKLNVTIDSAWVVNEWKAILDTLENDYGVWGIVIDTRHNYGANFNFWEIIERFYSDTVDVFRNHERCDTLNHTDLCITTDPFFSVHPAIHGDHADYCGLPVAILTGPNAESGGDLFPFLMSFRPATKLFGLPTCGAFSGTYGGQWKPGFYGSYAKINMKYSGTPERFMSRAVFPGSEFNWVDYEEVWLTPEGVSQGRDDVVEAAIAWITNFDSDSDGVANLLDNCPVAANSTQDDVDSDGVGDLCDNCPDISNVDQLDGDGDGIGAVCDLCDSNASGCCCAPGDSDHSSSFNIADVTYGIAFIFSGGPAPPCAEEADADDSGAFNIADVTYGIQHIFSGGPAPVCGFSGG